MFNLFVKFVRDYYGSSERFISLHEPVFRGNEKKYLLEAIDSTFVSSVGAFVNRFEEMMCEITGAKHAVAAVNGTAALHAALHVLDIGPDDLVITQALTFIATANAIRYTGADPVFLDVDLDTMGLSPDSLENFLKNHCTMDGPVCREKSTGRRVAACVPMHTFGFPARIQKIVEICKLFKIGVVEDSAESLGSYTRDVHTGRLGLMGIFSFNGNKTVTCGGGGAIITDDATLAKRLKHITTTAKVPHPYEFDHDELGFNYRMPNLNAALACAQLELLPSFIDEKRLLAKLYFDFFQKKEVQFVTEKQGDRANYWLNTILLPSKDDRDAFLKYTNENKIMTRPAWNLMCDIGHFKGCMSDDLVNSRVLADRIVNIPSGVKP